MAICNADRVFTYIYVGFLGSAHDSKVGIFCIFEYGVILLHFISDNSLLAQGTANYGPNKYFFDVNKYIVGDSAFPFRELLITPYKKITI